MSKPTESNTEKKSVKIEELRPAFSSFSRASYFLVFLVSILLIPEMITWSGLINRRHSYEIMTENHGAYSFVAKEVFDNEEDIDILFLGSSILFAGVDTPQVQRALSDELGRPAKVVTFGHYFNSIDVMHMQLLDVLEHKKIRMLVLSVPRMLYTDGPSTPGCRFIRYSDVKDIFFELPLKYKAALYACGILRAPRDVLSIVRRNRDSLSPSSFAPNLGADKAEIGIGRDPRTFSRFTPVSHTIPGSNMIYSPRTKDQFDFTKDEIPFYQNLFLEKLVETCVQKQIPLVILNIPQHTERHSGRVIERKEWTNSLKSEVSLVGVPPAVLFAGLSDEEIDRLRYDDAHFNANGSEFFTRTILPAIMEVYNTRATKNY